VPTVAELAQRHPHAEGDHRQRERLACDDERGRAPRGDQRALPQRARACRLGGSDRKRERAAQQRRREDLVLQDADVPAEGPGDIATSTAAAHPEAGPKARRAIHAESSRTTIRAGEVQ
jgi:hypothetical protein